MSGLKNNQLCLTLEQKRDLVEPEHPDLSIRRQCEVLSLNRSSLYYQPAEVSQEMLTLLNRVDELFTAHPFYGQRKLSQALKREGYDVGRDKAKTFMNLLGLEAIYPKPCLSQAHPEHRIYPYLLKNVAIERVNQVWSTDITYIRLSHGFMYLVAVIDWYSRYVLSWRLSNSLALDFCLEALTEALSFGCPEIFNSDQGSQFTSREFIRVLEESEIQISMDGRGRALDNVFVERLWRSVKYEDVYLHNYETVVELKQGLESYFRFYNQQRLHQALKYRTPHEVHWGCEAPGIQLSTA